MTIGPNIYPHLAVELNARSPLSIDGLSARCLWYPGLGSDGRANSGSVIYLPKPLHDPFVNGLEEHSSEAVLVEGVPEEISHRLIRTLSFTASPNVADLVDAIFRQVSALLPRGRRVPIARETLTENPKEALVKLENSVAKERLRVLVPVSVDHNAHLFTEATETFKAISYNALKRPPSISFVLLSKDTLYDAHRKSPWLREALQLMALPPHLIRAPEAVDFVKRIEQFVGAGGNELLIGDLASVLYQVTGGWADLCERFYECVMKLPTLRDLEEWLQRLMQLFRPFVSVEDPRSADALLRLAFADHWEPPDLTWADSTLWGQRFEWERHGPQYLAGHLGWEGGIASPRSRLIEIVKRSRRAQREVVFGQASSAVAGTSPSRTDELKVCWLHISDLKISDNIEMSHEALIGTVKDLRNHGRRVDFIFISGDIAWSGKSEQYKLAKEFLLRLCDAAEIHPNNIHMVPGNHDIDRTQANDLLRTLTSIEQVNQYFRPDTERLHMKKFQAFRAFYDDFYATRSGGGKAPRQSADGLVTSDAELVQIGRLSFGILPLNSVWFSAGEDDPGQLFVGEPLLRTSLARIQDATLRIALLHHPLSDLSDIERTIVDQRLQSGCHFVMHGRLHGNAARIISSGQSQTLFLGTGTSQVRNGVRERDHALFVEARVDTHARVVRVAPYPLRFEPTGYDRWTLDTSVYPRNHPSYLAETELPLDKSATR